MIMSERLPACLKGLGIVTAVGGIAALGFLVGRSAPNDVLARSYAKSFVQVEADWTGTAPMSGGNLWLSRNDHLPRAGRKALNVGDRINIGGPTGQSDTYEVTAVELIEGDVLGTPNSVIQIVTGRADGTENAATVRFIFAVTPPDTVPATPKPEKVL